MADNENPSPDKFDEAGEARLETLRAVEALGSGIRTTLRNNASAYGFSVTITAAFGMVSSTHAQQRLGWQIMLFAVGAAAAFVCTELTASHWFHRLAGGDPPGVLMISGAIDVLAILSAVAVAALLTSLHGIAAWPITSFGTTLVYLLVGGLDVLIARQAARARLAE